MPLRTAFGVFCGLAPAEGPKCMPVTLVMINGVPQIIDLFGEETTGQMSFVQGVYVDNSLNAAAFSLTGGIAGQLLTWGPATQGWQPVLAPDKARFTAVSGASLTITMHFVNFPVAPGIWKIT